MPQSSHYATLGVASSATESEIRRAYRHLALVYHPDKNHNDERSAQTFLKISGAHSILKDPELRRQYDRDCRLDGILHPSPAAPKSYPKNSDDSSLVRTKREENCEDLERDQKIAAESIKEKRAKRKEEDVWEIVNARERIRAEKKRENAQMKEEKEEAERKQAKRERKEEERREEERREEKREERRERRRQREREERLRREEEEEEEEEEESEREERKEAKREKARRRKAERDERDDLKGDLRRLTQQFENLLQIIGESPQGYQKKYEPDPYYRGTPHPGGSRWQVDEERYLLELRNQGLNWACVGKMLNARFRRSRTPGACSSKYYRLSQEREMQR